MSNSLYIDASEYASFNLPGTTNDGLVQQASALIDGYLARPEGLVWSPDAAGNPAYMAGLASAITLASGSGGILAGSNVVVPYSGPSLDDNSIGEVVVIDRTVNTKTESCVITAVTKAPNTLTLSVVQFDHSAGASMELGLVIEEQKEMPKDRSVVLLQMHPVMNLLSGVGRYAYGRRSEQVLGNFQEFNLLAVVNTFGGPPAWIPWPVADASINRRTGECWIPAGMFLAYYTEVKVWYVAGYQKSALPYNVKQACANIVLALKETGLGPNIRRRDQRDGVGTQRFENQMIDINTRNMLDPFHARNFN